MIILFIILTFFFLRQKENTTKKIGSSIRVKNNKKIKGFTKIDALFFSNKNNLSYLMANKIVNNFVCFNNYKMSKDYLKILSNAGFDLSLPIYKLEFYNDKYKTKLLNNNKKISRRENLNYKNKLKSNRNNKAISQKIKNIETYILKIKKQFYSPFKTQNKFDKKQDITDDIKSYLLKDIYLTFKTIYNLKLYNIFANYLIFLDDASLYKSVLKLMKYFNLDIKIYFKNEVDYKLLGAINYLNINTNISNCNLSDFIKEANIFNQNKNNFAYNYLYENLLNYDCNKTFNLSTKNQKIYFQNFEYNNHYLCCNISNEDFISSLKVTQNVNLNSLVFRLKIINKTDRKLEVNFNVKYSMGFKKDKNAVYFVNKSKSHIYLSNETISNKALILIGNFNGFSFNKFNIFSLKSFNISPKNTEYFYFVFSDKKQNIMNNINHFQNNEILLNLQNNEKKLIISKQELINKSDDNFTNFNLLNFKNYSNYIIKNIENLFINNGCNFNVNCKILTSNKTLNLLLNEYIPQRIVRNYIIGNFKSFYDSKIKENIYNQDFNYLINHTFDRKLIDKNLVKNNLKGLYLINTNLYKFYLNLFYYKLGVFISAKGINFNPDTSLIIEKAVISLKNKNVSLDIKNNNLNNEVIVDNIKYSNLQFLNLNSKSKILHLQF